MSRYSISAEFVGNSAKLVWDIIDNDTHLKVATVYVFDGTAQALCDMLNESPKEEVV